MTLPSSIRLLSAPSVASCSIDPPAFHLPRARAAALLPPMKPFLPRPALPVLILSVIFAGLGRAQSEPPLPPIATNLWAAVFPGFQNRSTSAPAVAPDGTIYTGTWLGDFLAYTPQGNLKWSYKAGREIHSSPAIADDGTIYFGSRDRKFYALAPDGMLKWTFATGAWVDSSPAIAADGTIYFGGWDRFFYALNPDGSLKWKTNVNAIVDSSPAIAADGTIYFGAHDKKLYALHPDGSVRWTFAAGGPIISSPAIGEGGTIYFSSVDGNLYAANPDGSERWRAHTGSATESSPVIGAGGNICIGVEYSTAFITDDGRERLRFGAPMSLDESAVAAGDRFYYSAPWRHVLAIRAGEADWQHTLWVTEELGDNVSAALTVSPEGIVYACAGFRLYALRPPGELLPPANSPWPMFRANPRHTGRVAEGR